MHSAPEAFLLLTLPDVALAGPALNPASGALYLEGVSFPQAEQSEDTPLYLVARLGVFETPIDPLCTVTRTDGLKTRTYRFSATQVDPGEFTLTVPGPFVEGDVHTDQVDALEGILAEYVAEFRSGGAGADSVVAVEPLSASQARAIHGAVSDNKDLRGHLVMINEDTGEIIGDMDDRFRIQEDALLSEAGHENDPVVIHIPDDYTRELDWRALEAFATIIPPDQRNWVSTSANIVSHAISMTTSLLISTISAGASLYVNHSSPSPHHPASRTATPTGGTGSSSAPGTPGAPPLPPRALTFLTSAKTRKNLSSVHALSGQAVKVSNKTVGLIDAMIRRAMGAKPKRQKYFPTGIPASGAPSSGLLVPGEKGPSRSSSRSPSPSPSPRLVPPPYTATGGEKSGGYPPDKPALPPRRATSPAPPLGKEASTEPVAFAPYQPTAQGPPPPLPERKLKTKVHILISADLILSTLDDSARRVLDAGTEQIGRVMGHKYGPQAEESSLYIAGTARNVGLVYIDMSGIGRRALLKRAGKTFLKARLSSNDPAVYPVPGQAPVPVLTPRK